MKGSTVLQYVAAGLAAVGLCLAAGCATTDTVSSRFPQLEENINAAKAAGAEIYAPNPLLSAQEKFAAAKSAVASGDMATADKLVDEAMADAHYARALAPTERARQEAQALREAIEAMRDEINRMPAVK